MYVSVLREPARRHAPWLAKGNKSFGKEGRAGYRRLRQEAEARRPADRQRGLVTADNPQLRRMSFPR